MLAIEQVPINLLNPNAANPRLNDAAVDAVARSIQAYGFNNPIICDESLNIAAGHTRMKAAKKLGMERVPVIRVPGLVGSKFTGFAIADNKTAEIAEWDKDLLAQLVSELNLEVDFDLGSLGFDDKELTDILDWNVEDETDKEDDAPPLPETPVTQPGDLYNLGDHRLLCGDATCSEDVRRLVEGEKIDCVLTDPPYGVSFEGRGERSKQFGPIRNDDLTPEALETFLRRALSNAASVCRSGATAYVFHALGIAGVRIAFEKAFLASGFHLSATLIWRKPSSTLGWGDYRHAAEPMLYGWIGEGHRRIKDRTQSTVWEIARDANLLHLTQKPTCLISRALRNSTIRGERVLDLFVGSGTTMIACEQLGRICCAMEIEPKYCDVVVTRWEQYTGKKAQRLPSAVAPVPEEVTEDHAPA